MAQSCRNYIYLYIPCLLSPCHDMSNIHHCWSWSTSYLIRYCLVELVHDADKMFFSCAHHEFFIWYIVPLYALIPNMVCISFLTWFLHVCRHVYPHTIHGHIYPHSVHGHVSYIVPSIVLQRLHFLLSLKLASVAQLKWRLSILTRDQVSKMSMYMLELCEVWF